MIKSTDIQQKMNWQGKHGLYNLKYTFNLKQFYDNLKNKVFKRYCLNSLKIDFSQEVTEGFVFFVCLS